MVGLRICLWVLFLQGWADGVSMMGRPVESHCGLSLSHLRGLSWALQCPPCCSLVDEGGGGAAMRGARTTALRLWHPL